MEREERPNHVSDGAFPGVGRVGLEPVRLPYSNPQWGSQLIFYWLYNASPYILLTVRALIVTGALGLIVWLCYWRTRSIRIASIVGIIAYFTTVTNNGMRPQLLAFIPFVAYLFILERKDAYSKWLPLLTPIMIFWVNVHGSFFIGVALMGVYSLGTILERLGTDEGRRWLISKQSAWQAACILAATLATLVNPYVAGIYKYFFIATNDPIARALNIEWQPPTIYNGTGILFTANLFILLCSLYLSKRRMRPTEILLLLAFGYLSITSLRNVIWWSWVTAPIMASNFAAIAANRVQRRAELAAANNDQPENVDPEVKRRELSSLNWAIATLLIVGPLVMTPLWRPANPLVGEEWHLRPGKQHTHKAGRLPETSEASRAYFQLYGMGWLS